MQNLRTDFSRECLGIYCESIDLKAEANCLVDELKLTLIDSQQGMGFGSKQDLLLICVTKAGIGLKPAGSRQKPVCVDFVGGAVGHRTRGSGQGAEMIGKAIGVKGGQGPYVVDATAGLGRDAFVLASLGCRVLMLEYHPVIAAMLRDGMRRGSQDRHAAAAVDKMSLCTTDALRWLNRCEKLMDNRPDVIYLDPMFPPRNKAAKVKKDMQVLHRLLGSSGDGMGLLDVALKVSGKRVVVKRPAKAAPLQEKEPDFRITGKTSRFDIYLTPPGMHD